MSRAGQATGRAAGGFRPCPVCGGAAVPRDQGDIRRPASAPAVDAVTCAGCGLVYLDPVPPEARRTESYGSGYYAPWQEAAEAARRRRLWSRRLAQVEARASRGALLDVGCGDGAFLETARGAGWRVEGIEFSPEGARRAAGRLGRPVALGDLAAGDLLRGPFDVVTLWHVLEHTGEPGRMLDAVRRRLRPGGLAVVAVPNLDNLPLRAAYRVARRRRLPLYESGGREPHVSHFRPASLAAALERHGFRAVEIAADRCALEPAKRAIDWVAIVLSKILRRLLTDAIVAFARTA